MNMLALEEDKGLRERAMREGIESGGDAELIGLVLGPGGPGRASGVVAAELLAELGGLVGLAREGLRGEVRALSGIGELRRARLEASLEIGRRLLLRRALASAAVFSGPAEVASWARAQLGLLSHEELWLLALDARHRLVTARRVAQGGGRSCGTTAKEILRTGLRAGASAFLLVHNHPSGDPTPSAEDARMTVEVARAAEVVGMPLLDHVVVGSDGHASLFELGLLERPARS